MNPITQAYVALIAYLRTPPRRRDDGSVSLEQVVWTLALLLAAGAAVALITTAITNRTSKIN